MRDGIRIATLATVLMTTQACQKQAEANVQETTQEPQAEALRVDTDGVTARILYEAPIDGGHVPELIDKYKLRVTEIVINAGGHVGDHNHLGPGIRQMTDGEMEYVLPDHEMIYKTGDFFFETGDVSHHVNNRTDRPNTHILFEILPVSVEGPSLILPRDK